MQKEQLKHQISFNQVRLPWNKSVKYLGIILDSKILQLALKKQIKEKH